MGAYLLLGNLLFYFCQLIPRQIVGISVGISSDRRRKLFIFKWLYD